MFIVKRNPSHKFDYFPRYCYNKHYSTAEKIIATPVREHYKKTLWFLPTYRGCHWNWAHCSCDITGAVEVSGSRITRLGHGRGWVERVYVEQVHGERAFTKGNVWDTKQSLVKEKDLTLTFLFNDSWSKLLLSITWPLHVILMHRY